MIHTVKLVPKPTGKGNKILNDAGKPAQWIVKDQKDTVSYSERPGPWLFVSPDATGHTDYHNRWVSLTDDNDFFVEVIR